MTDPKPQRKGRRLGGPPPTPSTLDDPTPPEAPGQLVPAPAPAVQPAAAAPAAPPASEPQQGPVHLVPPPAHGQDERPRAEDIVRPREEIRREQISVMVPKALDLRKRMRRYWVDTEVEVRDQAALALDAWLRANGY